MDNPLYTAFLEFKASFPEEARILSEDPAITTEMCEGLEPLPDDALDIVKEVYLREEVLAGIADDEDDLHSSI